MNKLLVNTPSGVQEIIEVGAGGGYFDETRVLWDERQDGPLPDVTLGGMVRVNGALVIDESILAEHVTANQVAEVLRIKALVPKSVTMRQARLALLENGLLAAVQSAVASMQGTDGDKARIEWEFSSTVERDKGLVLSFASALSITEDQLDALFTQASLL